MNLISKLKSNKILASLIIAIGISALTVAPTTFACGYWHPCRSNNFAPGLVIGGIFGFLAGAAVASNNHNGYYSRGSCRRVYVTCNTYYNRFGRYRRCYRHVRWVC